MSSTSPSSPVPPPPPSSSSSSSNGVEEGMAFPTNHPANPTIPAAVATATSQSGTVIPRESMNLTEGVSFVSARALTWTLASGLYGATSAYLQGVSVTLPFYTYGTSAMIASTTFFAGSYLSRYVREKDDTANYAISGLVNGFVSVSLLSGMKKGGIAGIVGGGLGALYSISSNWLYAQGREAWIQHRIQHLYFSKERKLVVTRPQFPSVKQREEVMLKRKQQAKAKEEEEERKKQQQGGVATEAIKDSNK